MIDIALQALIVCFGVCGLWLASSQRRRVRVYAGVLGILAQPAWAMLFTMKGQWLMLPLCLLYGWCHVRMIRNNWDGPLDPPA